MGSFKDFDKKAPPPGSTQAPDQRKNDEEVGEPVQLPDDGTTQSHKPSKQGKKQRQSDQQQQ